jgi:hypothetical protein
VGGRGQGRAAHRRRCGSFRRALRAGALRRAELPRPVAPVAGRVQCPPYHPGAAPVREDQAVKHAGVAPTPGRSRRRRRNAAHCPGRPLQPQRCFASRYAGRACGALLTPEPLPTQRA